MAGLLFSDCNDNAISMDAPGAGGQRQAPRGRGQRPAREDDRHARPLHHPGGAWRYGRRDRGHAARPRHRGGRRRPHRPDGRAGHRRRGDQHQPGLVPRRARRRQGGVRHPERAPGRVLRDLPGPLPGLRLAGAAVPGPGGAAARVRHEDARPARRGRSAPASRATSSPTRSFTRSGPRRRSSAPALHPPAEHAGARKRFKGNGWLVEHDRQPAGHDDRAVAPDLRRHAGPVPGAQDLLGARRRLPAVVRAALRQRPARGARHGHRRRSSRSSRRSTCARCTSTRWCSRRKRCGTSPPRWA